MSSFVQITIEIEMNNSILFYYVLFSLVAIAHFVDETTFICNTDTCLTAKCPNQDMKICINETLATMIPSPIECNCCDACLLYQKLGESCIVGSPGQQLPNQICGPGLRCEKGKCTELPDPSIDPLLQHNYECDENNICTCMYRSEDHTESIFGSFELDPHDKSLQCACSIVAYKAKTHDITFLPFDGLYQGSARCLPNGQFDPLQCYDGMCGCVDQWSGAHDVSLPLVAISSVREGNPLCYNSTLNHFIGYYTECEQALRNLQVARDLIEAEGKIFLIPFTIECFPDGSYVHEPTPEIKMAITQLNDFVTKYH